MSVSTKIIAHRGIPPLEHENTMNSFKRACELKADMIEFDVRKTRDKQLVAFHDPTIIHNRTTYPISDVTFENLQFIAKQQGFEIPLIKDIFSSLHDLLHFDIELKEKDCEEEITNLIREYRTENSSIITSFLPSVVMNIQKNWPHIHSGLLIGKETDLFTPVLSNCEYLCPSFDMYMSHNIFFEERTKQGKKNLIWTVDNPDSLKQLLTNHCVNGIITNRCDLAIELRNQISA
jgi:glycerophosphoryl diester phosphodiesterase